MGVHPFTEAQCLIEQFLSRAEAEHVADPHAVGVPAEQLVDRCSERLADCVPDGGVNGSLGNVIVDGSSQHGVDLFPVRRLHAHQLGGEHVIDDRRNGFLGLGNTGKGLEPA